MPPAEEVSRLVEKSKTLVGTQARESVLLNLQFLSLKMSSRLRDFKKDIVNARSQSIAGHKDSRYCSMGS